MVDKVTYVKRTLYNLFRFNFFTKTEIYSETAGEEEGEVIQIFVKPEQFDYYRREFGLKKDDKK